MTHREDITQSTFCINKSLLSYLLTYLLIGQTGLRPNVSLFIRLFDSSWRIRYQLRRLATSVLTSVTFPRLLVANRKLIRCDL